MRKIKITALVLAVLMVMAAFAGCASKSAVEDLDERVTALEGKIDANQKANEEKIDELAALIEALTKSQSDIKDSVESNKNDQAASNQQILDAINKLTEKVEQVEKDQDAADKADKEAQAAAKELQAYKATNAAKIATLEASYLANKADYAAEDYVKIVEILATANIAVEQANDKAAVDAAMKKLDTDLNGYTTVNQGIYNIYLELKGNIVPGDATKAKVEAAQAALTAAQDHYNALGTPEKLTKFPVGGFQADGKTPKTINLVDALTVICTTFTSTIDSYNTRLTVVEPDGTKTVYATLAYVEARAKELIAAIELASKLDMLLVNTNTIITLGDQYQAWLTFANLLSTENAKFVTNTATLDKIVAEAKNLIAAQKAFGETLNFDAVNKVATSIFADYTKLGAEDAGKTLYSNYENVYVKIDKALAAWKAQYKLSDKQVADIVAVDYTVVNQYNQAVISHKGFAYSNYVNDRNLCQWYYEAYKVFSNTIAPQVKALSKKLVSINNADHIAEFRAIALAIDEWSLVKKLSDAEYGVYNAYTDVTIDSKKNLYVSDINFNAMVNDIELKVGYADGFDTSAATNVDYLGLYTFGQGAYKVDGVINAFFQNTYFSALAIAEELNTRINSASTASVLDLIVVSGEYNVSGNKFWAKHEKELDALAADAQTWFAASVTVGDITLPVYKDPALITKLDVATFKRSSQEYDLASVLVDNAKLASKKASIEARIQTLKPIAADIVSAIKGLTAANVEANVNLDAHETKINKAYNDQFLPNWVLDGAVVAYAEAVAKTEKVDTIIAIDHDLDTTTPNQIVEWTTYVYTLTDLLTAAQCETLHFAAAEVDDLRKQADVLIAAYKTIADMNAVAPITIKSILANTMWYEFSFAAKASKTIYYVTAPATEDKELFAVALYEDTTSTTEAMAKAALATELLNNALTYGEMIEAVSAYYATFKADNAGKTAKDVTAAMGDFAKYELMAKKAVILDTIKGEPADTTLGTPATGLYALVEGKTEDVVNAVTNKFYNTIFEVVSAAKDIKAVKEFLESDDFEAQWAEYGLGAMNIPATTYAGASLLAAITVG